MTDPQIAIMMLGLFILIVFFRLSDCLYTHGDGYWFRLLRLL